MCVAHPRRNLVLRYLPGADLVTMGCGLALLVAALVGVLPSLAALALAVGTATTVAVTRLIGNSRQAASHRAGAPRRDSNPSAPLSRRSMILLATAVVVAGLTAAALPLTPVAYQSSLALVGLIAALMLHIGGLLALPGAVAATSSRWLRQAVDAVSLALCLAFTGWVLLPLGPVTPLARMAILPAAAGIAVIMAMALASWMRPVGTGRCALGSAITLLGLTILVVLLDYGSSAASALVLPPLVAGPLLTAAGAARVATPKPGVDQGRYLPAYPLLTAPITVAALAAVFHLAVVGELETPAILLGAAVVPALMFREVLAVHNMRRYVHQLAAREGYFRSLVAGANELTLVVGEDKLIRWQSPAAARLFGLTDAEVLGRPFAALVHPDDAPRVSAACAEVLAGRPPSLVNARLRDGGAWRETESTVTDQRAVPEVAALVVHVRDVSERRRLERVLRQVTVTDQLTGLVNRRELMRVLTERHDQKSGGALLVIDLHGMAAVNNEHGRTAGDQVLFEAGRRVRAGVDPDDVVARLAGDEFAVAVAHSAVLAYALGTRLLAALTEPYPLPEGEVRLQVSIGLAECTGEESVDDVLRQADLARRRARQLGRNRVEWYDADLEKQLLRRVDLERELPGAVARGELDLVYQPILSLVDRVPVGIEALVRWRNPTLGTVLPAELLPVAEELGLIEEVGQWVLRRACRQLAAWSDSNWDLWMAINVSPRELASPEFVNRVSAALTTHGVPPERLVVEVNEHQITSDISGVAGQLAGLRALGVRVALDDYGVGQASLARLRQLPFDLMKVDSAVVDNLIRESSRATPLIDVVVGLGRRLGVEVVAEGLESSTQVDEAYRAGCRYGQGFALSRPATAERVEAFLEEFPSAP